MHDIRSEAERLISESISVNTLHSYETGLSKFVGFRESYRMPQSWPPTLDQVVLFLSSLSLEGLAPSTAKLYKTAISWKCKLIGAQDVTDNYVITKILTGFQRSAVQTRTRLPITLEILQSIIAKLPLVCENLYESSLFTAAFSLAFHGFLRIGEIVVTRSEYAGRVISVSDLVVEQSKAHIRLTIRGSKTDQIQKGQTLLIPRTDSVVCPVVCIEQFMKRRPRFGGPLFCHLDGRPLTRFQFSAILKKSLFLVGANYKLFNTHSFRIGAATSAAMRGFDSNSIMSAGRWQSTAYKRYVKLDSVSVLPALTGLLQPKSP